jgi:hypothetical protein
MKGLFFKTKDGALLNLDKFREIVAGEGNTTVLMIADGNWIRIGQPISDIENFLLKVQEAL